MVTLRLTMEECQILLTWADLSKDKSSSLRVPFEADEKRLMNKLRMAWDKAKGLPRIEYCPKCGGEMDDYGTRYHCPKCDYDSCFGHEEKVK